MKKKLLIAKRKLQLRLPKLNGRKAIRAQDAINKIDERLASMEVLEKEAPHIGGLDFQVPSPPGLGRLVTLPFYPVNANPDIVTASGTNTANSQNPSMIALIGNTTNNCTSEFVLETPQISWAKLRIVGFEVEAKTLCGQAVSAPMLMVSDLKIGGGTNLFTHESFADASFYAQDVEDYAGLRDYPVLEAPNTAMVTVAAVSPTATGDRITFSMSLVCDVISDENYGEHLVGPYARGASMVRYKGKVEKYAPRLSRQYDHPHSDHHPEWRRK
jgi:hypothetical protein